MRPAIHPRQPPVSVDEWECFRDDWGRITPEKELRFRGRVMYGVSYYLIINYTLFESINTYAINFIKPCVHTHTHTSQGIEEKLRKEAWKYLLGYMPFGDTDIERMDLRVVS